jgi:FlaG/FlaF family flagellin (archaellin)
MKNTIENAVSPVVGVMLMLVVTIIIAAIVSAFAGGAISGVSKVPQASITGKFSVANGLEIDHSGGDAIPLETAVFTIYDDDTFGTNLNQKTSQVLNQSLITDINGNSLISSSGVYNITALLPGTALYINGTSSSCQNLQPTLYTEGQYGYCISNSSNIGKTFTLMVGDDKGNLISTTDITIQP